MNLMELVKERKSVRSYDGKDLSAEDMEKLKECVEKAENPYGYKIDYRFLDAKENGLKSPVLAGEKCYIAGKMKFEKDAEAAFGYSFEKFVLFAQSLGIGTVWIGGTMNRDVFEKVMELADDELMPCVSPIGYPAKKRSVKESMMRKAIKADSRVAFEEIFFDKSFDKPLKAGERPELDNALEMVRWAPSAVNKQPWRLVIDGNTIHFYEKHSKGYINDKGFDMQKIDIGIAMCHFDMAMEEEGKSLEFKVEDPGIAKPEGVDYIASYVIK